MSLSLTYKKQILFAMAFGGILYAGYNEAEDSVTNYKRGLLAACFILVCQGVLSQYRGPFIKGFEWFWRGVARYCVIYLVALIFLLFQTSDDARQLLTHLFSGVGKPVIRDMHTYDEDCDFTPKNIWNDLDHYYAMHWVGWFVLSFMVRDPVILHFWSVLDEILELSWQHILPHFRECWWDHILVDLTMSNTPAITLGMLVIKKTGLREFDWLGRKGKKSIKEWDIFYNHRRCGLTLAFVLVMISNFLTGFFLINSLWIPPKNAFNIYRLSVWFLLGQMAIGEHYDDIETWGTSARKGDPISNEYRWIACGVATVEALISYKFRHGTGNIKDVPTPLYISIPWIVTVTVCVGYYLYLRFSKERVTIYGDSEWEIRKAKAKALGVKEEAKPKSQPKNEEAKNKKETNDEGKSNQNGQKDEIASPTKKIESVPAKANKGKANEKQAETGKNKKTAEKEKEEEEEEFVPTQYVKPPEENEWKTVAAPKNEKPKKKKKAH